MKPVDLRNPDRERFQMQAFDGEQLAWNSAEMFFVRAVDAITPLAGLLIQVLPAGEGASGKEVVINKIERPLHACRAIGIATLVSGKTKAESFSKRPPLGDRDHRPSGSSQNHDVGVVDH